MILDKLIEKKDLLAYIRFRKEELIEVRLKETLKQKPKRRELVRQRFDGRIRELEKLETLLIMGQVKSQSIRIARKMKSPPMPRSSAEDDSEEGSVSEQSHEVGVGGQETECPICKSTNIVPLGENEGRCNDCKQKWAFIVEEHL